MTTTKLLKIALYVTGSLLLIISCFMVFSTSIVPVDSEVQFESIPLNGFHSVLWYFYILLALVLTLIAFNINSVGMKAVFYFTLVIGGLLTAYIAFISSFKWGLSLSCAFLPYERSEYGIKNGIDHDDFFIFWIFGLLLLVLGFRKTLMSKILTFTIVGLSVLIYYNLHCYDYLYQNKSYAIGAYIATLSYLSLATFATYMLFKKKKM